MRGKILFVAALIAFLPLVGWWATGLFDLDEGFYAAVSGEMLRRGEWITPFYNGRPWFEKPILLYWLAIPTLKLFGQEFGARLPSVLGALALYAGLFVMGRRWLGERAALLGALVCATSLLVAALGRLMMTDALLCLGLTMSFLCFYRSLEGGVGWRVAAAAWLGVSVLAKGPVGGLFMLLILGVTYWREPELRPGFKGWAGWLLGILAFFVVVGSWYLPAYLANPEVFVQEFLIKQNIGRFSGGDAAHTVRGWGYLLFFPVMLVGMAPWIWRLGPAVRFLKDEGTPFLRYCARWALLIFLFFTISSAKLVHYVAPVIPPLALLLGAYLDRRRPADLSLRDLLAPGVTAAVMCILLNGGLTYWYQASGQEEAHAFARELRAESGTVAAYQLPRRQKGLGTGKPKIQETSLPSFIFVLDRPVVLAEDPSDLLTAEWVFTRTNRAVPPGFTPVKTGTNYAIYRRTP